MGKLIIKNIVILFNPLHGDKVWHPTNSIPYALLYLERMLRDLNVKILLIDEQVTPEYEKIILQHKERILLAGVSAMTGHQIARGLAFSKLIKEKTVGQVVWGGWHATLLPEQTLAHALVDFVIAGQGETPLRELVSCLQENKPIHTIAGLGYKRDLQVYINKRASFQNIQSFSQIHLDALDITAYVKTKNAQRSVIYFCSHGCPFECGFCCLATVYERKWQHKKIETIMQELWYFKNNAHIDFFLFQDDNFFANKKFVMTLCRMMLEEKMTVCWAAHAHIGLFTQMYSEEDMRFLYAAGCRKIGFGAESGDNKILKKINKHLMVEETFSLVEKLHKQGIISTLSVVVGWPFDIKDEYIQTLDMMRRAKLIDFNVEFIMNFYTPYPGTAIYKDALAKGFIPPQRLEDWAEHTVVKYRAPGWEH